MAIAVFLVLFTLSSLRVVLDVVAVEYVRRSLILFAAPARSNFEIPQTTNENKARFDTGPKKGTAGAVP
jgi:hypothetical protein